VRASFYHLTDRALASDLVASARAGATVQVLLDGSNRRLGCAGSGCVNPAFAVLEQLNGLGNNKDWLKTCNGIGPNQRRPAGRGNGCIGQVRDHNKFILIQGSKAIEWERVPNGDHIITSHDVVLQTSSNNTASSYQAAFNDALVTVNQPSVYDDYLRYFRRLARSYSDKQPPPVNRFARKYGNALDTATLANHDISTWSFPQAIGQDPIAGALARVGTVHSCANVRTQWNSPPQTVIDLAMSRVRGRLTVMRELATLRQAGCKVTVVYGEMSARDHSILSSAGVELRRLCLASPAAPATPNMYVHSKYLLLDGTVGLGADLRVVFTGSDNLDTGALSNTDDRIVRYVEPASNAPIFDAYAGNFFDLRWWGMMGSHSTSQCGGDD
jgi:phosphatidylserine/phosphatidylglycerophosphate/cardiolipin synthase-like enzyme